MGGKNAKPEIPVSALFEPKVVTPELKSKIEHRKDLRATREDQKHIERRIWRQRMYKQNEQFMQQREQQSKSDKRHEEAVLKVRSEKFKSSILKYRYVRFIPEFEEVLKKAPLTRYVKVQISLVHRTDFFVFKHDAVNRLRSIVLPVDHLFYPEKRYTFWMWVIDYPGSKRREYFSNPRSSEEVFNIVERMIAYHAKIQSAIERHNPKQLYDIVHTDLETPADLEPPPYEESPVPGAPPMYEESPEPSAPPMYEEGHVLYEPGDQITGIICTT